MGKMKMAACGMDCGECASYKVTADGDAAAAESIAGWYRGRGWIGENEGAEAVLKKAPLCHGCWEDNEDSFFKYDCHMLKCCKEKRLDHCAMCGDFPREFTKAFSSGHEMHKKATNRLQSIKETR